MIVCGWEFCPDVPKSGVPVRMGRILDGVADHMRNYDEDDTFVISEALESTRGDVVRALRDAGAEIVVNYVPVGSEEAARFYAEVQGYFEGPGGVLGEGIEERAGSRPRRAETLSYR